jgi:hypothetical protein
MPAGDALDTRAVRREVNVETSTVVPRPRGQQRQPDRAVEPVTETRQVPGEVIPRSLELLSELVDTEVAPHMKVEQGVVLTSEGCRRVPDELDQFPVERVRRIGEPLGLKSRVDESLALLESGLLNALRLLTGCSLIGQNHSLALNRGGNRQANAALYRIGLVRMRYHQPTKDYVDRHTSEGKSKPEIIRCLKRYVAREVYTALKQTGEANLARAV